MPEKGMRGETKVSTRRRKRRRSTTDQRVKRMMTVTIVMLNS